MFVWMGRGGISGFRAFGLDMHILGWLSSSVISFGPFGLAVIGFSIGFSVFLTFKL